MTYKLKLYYENALTNNQIEPENILLNNLIDSNYIYMA